MTNRSLIPRLPQGSLMVKPLVEVEPKAWIGWIGVAALAVIGVSAVVYGQRHEVEAQIKRQEGL